MPENTIDPAAPEPWLRVARIVRPHGVHGEVLAELLTDFPDRFRREPQVSVRAPTSSIPARTLHVEQSRLHGGRVILKLAGFDSMDQAEMLRDHEIVVPWEARSPLAEDEVYIAELVGCTLIDTATDAAVGPVTGVDRESGATELLVVASQAGELLVPFVKAYAPRWDLAARTLHMQLPDGLLSLPEPVGEQPQRERKREARTKSRASGKTR